MNIKMYWVGASTIVFDVDGVLKFAFDPCLVKEDSIVSFNSFDSKRVISPKYDTTTFKDIDMWFFTHGHLDHIDNEGKLVVDKNSYIFTCKNVKLILDDPKYKNKSILKWYESYSTNFKGYEIKITAIPAYHGSNFIMRTATGKVNGYLIELMKNDMIKTIYITSDTVYHKNIIQKIKDVNIDYLVANLGQVMSSKSGGPITMSVKMLNQFCKDLNIKRVIPIHFNDFSHYETQEIELINGGYEVIERGKWLEV